MRDQHRRRQGWAWAWAVLSLASCTFSTLPIDGLACDDQHGCAEGHACMDGRCIPLSETECTTERLAQTCSAGKGACARSGPQVCIAGRAVCNASPLAPGVEVCDGIDNDCDGLSDEALSSDSCELSKGVCAGATRVCSGAAGWGPCNYGSDYEIVETRCDGLDNDCDGSVDETLVGAAPACELGRGVCSGATRACAGAAGWGACVYGPDFEPLESSCDGLDNDCNGEIDEVPGCQRIETIVGDGPPGMRDGAGPDARFGSLKSLAKDAQGNLYLADFHNHALRKIAPDGTVITLAGDGVCGFQDGPAATARLCAPWDLELGPDGTTLYFSDSGNHRLRKLAGGAISTLAGAGPGRASGSALGEARFNQPAGIKVQPDGSILVADRGNHLIRRYDPVSGVVVDLAGSGVSGTADGARTTLQLFGPNDVAADAAGTLYVSESSHRIRLVPASGTSSTLAGSTTSQSGAASDAAGTAARFSLPQQLELEADDGALYVADSNNFRVRRVPLDPAQLTTSVVGTSVTSSGFKNGTCAIAKFSAINGFAHVGTSWFLAEALGVVRRGTNAGVFASPDCTIGDFAGGTVDERAKDGPALQARLRRPLGLERTADGVLYWVERDDGKLRKLEGGEVTTLIGLAGGGFEDGSLATAKMDNARDLTIGQDGKLYLVESLNHVVRVVDLVAGTVSTLAGIAPPVASGVTKSGYSDSSTDAHAVRFNQPRAIAAAVVSGVEWLYVADSYNCVVRRVEASTGFTGTYAGVPGAGPSCPGWADGPAGTARIQVPAALAADDAGNVYVADVVAPGSTRVRRIKPDGSIATLHTLSFEVNGLLLQGSFLVASGDGHLHTLSLVAPYAQNDLFSAANLGWRDGAEDAAGALEFSGLAADETAYYLTDEMTGRIKRLRK